MVRSIGAVVVTALLAAGLSVLVTAAGLATSTSEAGATLAPGTLNLDNPGPPAPIGPPPSSPMSLFSRDAGVSTPLSDGRTLWIYADTTLDGVYASLRGTGAIGEAATPLLLWEPTTKDGAGKTIPATPLLDGVLPGCPAGQDQFAWPMSAVTVPQGNGFDKVEVYFQALCGSGLDVSTFTSQSMGIAELVYDSTVHATTTGYLKASVTNPFLFGLATNRVPAPPGYGAAAAYKDGYVYVWQCSYPTLPPSCQVGRVLPAGVANAGSYTFWNGSTWVANPASAATLSLPGYQTGYFKPSIDYVAAIGAWVWVDGDYPQRNVYVRTAPAPQGPWSAATRIPTAACTGVNCRAPELHEQLSTADALAVSYIDVSVLPEHRMLTVPMHVTPFGALDTAVFTGPSTVSVSGWGIDPDTAAAITVHLYVDGTPTAITTANQYRADLATAYPAYGGGHGFSASLNLSPGAHTVCAYGINVGIGTNGLLGCRAVDDPRPIGYLDAVTATSTAAVTAGGWTLDPDTASALTVSFTVDGVAAGTTTASLSRPDIGAAYPSAGPNHGFSLVLPVSSAVHSVCATAINVGNGSGDTPLGCRNASPLPQAPTGAVANAGAEAATVTWAAPAATGGLPVTAYDVVLSTGGTVTVPGGQTSATVTGLTGGTAVSFTVAARTAAGIGPASAPTAAVVPTAAPGGGFHAVTPYRALDSRTTVGGWNGAALGAGEVRDLVIAPTGGAGGVPASARAVVLNVTVTGASAASYLTAFPAGAVPPTAANLLFAPAQTVPNLVTVKVGAGGKVSLFNQQGSVHVVVDVVGWYDDGSAPGSRFTGATPTRLLDTRTGTGGPGGAVGAGQTRNVTVAGAGGVPASATAVVLNVTVTGGTAASYLQVTPAGSPAGTTANLLFAAGQTVPNLVVVGVGANGQVAMFNQQGSVQVIADVVGWYDASPSGGLFHGLSPRRLLDSRTATGGWAGTPLGPGQSRSLAVTGGPVPSGATGLVLNATVTGATAASYVAVSPSPGPVPAPTANLLFGAGQTVPNAVVVRLPPAGSVDWFNQQGSVHVIADAAGWFAAT